MPGLVPGFQPFVFANHLFVFDAHGFLFGDHWIVFRCNSRGIPANAVFRRRRRYYFPSPSRIKSSPNKKSAS